MSRALRGDRNSNPLAIPPQPTMAFAVAKTAKVPAPHVESSNFPALALLDTDLQQVIAAWDGLPEAIRKAVIALVEVQKAGG